MAAQIASGEWKGTVEELKQAIATAVGYGAILGMQDAIEEYTGKRPLAKKTGKLRVAFLQSVKEHVSSQFGNTQIKINIKRIVAMMEASVSYAQYHIDGKPHHEGDTSAYDNPTTDPSYPFDTKKFREVAIKNIRLAVTDNIRSSGLGFVIKK